MIKYAGVIVKFKKTILLGKRSGNGCKYEGHWSIPCGRVERGESTLKGAERELFEETGIKAEHPLEYVCSFKLNDREIFYTYLLALNEMLLPSPDAEDSYEHSEWGYFETRDTCLPSPMSAEIKESIFKTNK
jgi:ADP-ribose pyrophosphatase YjhB (NUDIX family)